MGDTRARSQGLNSSPDLRWVSLGSPVPDQTKPGVPLPVSGIPRPITYPPGATRQITR
jgi:hypothetical protein